MANEIRDNGLTQTEDEVLKRIRGFAKGLDEQSLNVEVRSNVYETLAKATAAIREARAMSDTYNADFSQPNPRNVWYADEGRTKSERDRVKQVVEKFGDDLHEKNANRDGSHESNS